MKERGPASGITSLNLDIVGRFIFGCLGIAGKDIVYKTGSGTGSGGLCLPKIIPSSRLIRAFVLDLVYFSIRRRSSLSS